jgi:Ca-activated chloride channel family protein
MNTDENFRAPTMRERMCAALLGEAGPDERAALEREVAADPVLAAEWRRLEATVGLVRASYAGEAGLPDAVHAELARAARRGRFRLLRGRVRHLRAAAAVLAVGLAALLAQRLLRSRGGIGDELAGTLSAPSGSEGDRSVLGRGTTPSGGVELARRAINLRDEVDRVDAIAAGTPVGDVGAIDEAGAADPAPGAASNEEIAATRRMMAKILRESATSALVATHAEIVPSDPHVVLRAGQFVIDAAQPGATASGRAGPTVSWETGGELGLPLENGSTSWAEPGSWTEIGAPSDELKLGVIAIGEPVEQAAAQVPDFELDLSALWNWQAGSGGDAASIWRYADTTAGFRVTPQTQPLDPASAPSLWIPLQPGTPLLEDTLGARVGVQARLELVEAREAYPVAAQPPSIDLLVQACAALPGEGPRDMFFRFWGDNPFVRVADGALSTLAIDVDTASYALARSYLMNSALPTKAQVRTEEFVNYFRPDLAAPARGDFALALELAPSRFGRDVDTGAERWMLRCAVRGREVSDFERRPVALTLVIDTSGSMEEGQRLELVKRGVREMAKALGPGDFVTVVAFTEDARVVLEQIPATQRWKLEDAVAGLAPVGGTNVEAGLVRGYAEAAARLVPGASNRVVLFSDGVGNIGATDQARILERVAAERAQGVLLNTVGVGYGNHDDHFLEQLADRGDGVCNYVDSDAEARRALVQNFTGAFETIARDVKLQVEFDPAQVRSWRQLGYENRALTAEQFRDDAVDAGEFGAGHQVVALYELELEPGAFGGTAPLATLRLRSKGPEARAEDPATEIAATLAYASLCASWEAAGNGYKRSVLAAQFAELLRRSVHARGDSLDELIAEAESLEKALVPADPDWTELTLLLRQTRELLWKHLDPGDELTQSVDALRRANFRVSELEREIDGAAAAGRAEPSDTERGELERKLAESRRESAELEQRLRELWQTRQERAR